MATRLDIGEAKRRAVEFDPSCVALGTQVIDWGSFGFGNTVVIHPSLLGVKMTSLRKAAYAAGKKLNANVAQEEIDGDSLAVVFTRKSMMPLAINQGEWLRAVEPAPSNGG